MTRFKQMVKDAEAHAEEDRKFHELVNARNQADAMVHAATKSLARAWRQGRSRREESIEDAIEAVKTAS